MDCPILHGVGTGKSLGPQFATPKKGAGCGLTAHDLPLAASALGGARTVKRPTTALNRSQQSDADDERSTSEVAMMREAMQKLDAPLAEMWTGGALDPTTTIPVVIRVSDDQLRQVAEQVVQLGGTIRHQLNRLSALGAWLPVSAIAKLAEESAVRSLEMEQQFSIA